MLLTVSSTVTSVLYFLTSSVVVAEYPEPGFLTVTLVIVPLASFVKIISAPLPSPVFPKSYVGVVT